MHHPWKFWKKALVGLTLLLLSAALTASWLYRREIARVWFVTHLFDGSAQVESFRHMDRYFRMHVAHRAGPESPMPAASTALALPVQYRFAGQTRSTQELLDSTETTGLIVLRNGQVLHEHYALGNDASTHWMGWSLGKSVVSSLIGLALQEGFIDSIDDPLTRYAPELSGSAYDGVTIRQALQMSSGVSWNENYGDSQSDVVRFGRTFAFGGSLEAFARTLKREHAPGTFHRYNSLDVQVLGMVLENATDRSLSSYLEQRLWSHIGASADAYWVIDDSGSEFAAGGLSLTLRDWARFGQLHLQHGRWQGEELMPRDWVALSHQAGAPHLRPGPRDSANTPLGYGLLWWLPQDNTGLDSPYVAIGVYNQFIYIDPARQVVIVKTSANRRYGVTPDESSLRENETLAWLKAVAEATDR